MHVQSLLLMILSNHWICKRRDAEYPRGQKDNKTRIPLSPTYHWRRIYCQNKASQVPPNLCSTPWKTRKLKSLLSPVCFKKLLSSTWKEIQRSLQGQKRVGGQFENSRPSSQQEFWDIISSGSKKQVRHYIFAYTLYKKHFASSLISSVVKGFSLLAVPAGDCCADKMMSPPGIPPKPCQLSPPSNRDTGYKKLSGGKKDSSGILRKTRNEADLKKIF